MAVSPKTEVKIVIEAPDIRTLAVEVNGTTPLIFNRWSEKAIRQIEDKQQKKAAANKKHDVREPEAEYLKSFYRDADGYLAFPVLCFKQAMIGATRNVNGLTMTLVRGVIFLQGDTLGLVQVLIDGKPVRPSSELSYAGLPEHEIGIMAVDSQNPNLGMRRDVVRLQGIGSPADLRYRMQASNWSVKLLIRYNHAVLSPEQILNLLQIAGFSSGIGEWRNERSGNSGAFEIKQG